MYGQCCRSTDGHEKLVVLLNDLIDLAALGGSRPFQQELVRA